MSPSLSHAKWWRWRRDGGKGGGRDRKKGDENSHMAAVGNIGKGPDAKNIQVKSKLLLMTLILASWKGLKS